MAFFKNNKNVGLCLLVKNDEILISYSLSPSNERIERCDKLKCPSSVVKEALKDPGASNKQAEQQESKQNYITTAAPSNCNKSIVACDSSNSLHLWKHEDNRWKYEGVRSIVRKCQKAIFTNSSSDVILADRGGDVFSFSVSKPNETGNFILGHISLVLDIAISSDDKYLATCDRDGKIRVSSYPNSYNIICYCLGHQEFISSIQFVPLSEEVLLSGSGDGTIRLWHNFKGGVVNTCVNLHTNNSLSKHCNISDDGDEKLNDRLESESIPDNLVLSEKQILFSVRSVKYNEKYQLFGVLFHLHSGIAIYQLSDDTQLDFGFKQFIPLDTPPLDAIFTDDGHLFVLTKHKINTFAYFEYNKAARVFSEVVDKSPSLLVQEIKMFYKNQQQIAFQDDFVSLFKRVYEVSDNSEDCIKPKKNKTE